MDVDESGNHHSQQTGTRRENQTLHVLTHGWVLNNENTGHREGSITFWGLLEGTRELTVGEGRLERDNIGRNARYR